MKNKELYLEILKRMKSSCLLYLKGKCLKNRKACDAKCAFAAYYLERTLIETNEKLNELKKWLPIVTRLEKQFGCYEKAKGINYKTYTEQIFTELDKLKTELKNSECHKKHPNQCHCAFRCLGNDFCDDAEKRINTYKTTLTEIKFWARELLKRTGQIVPYEIKQILQKISECEVNNG